MITTLALYQSQYILPMLGFGKPKLKLQLPDGTTHTIKASGLRLECLRLNQQCVWCGVRGNVWLLQQTKQDNPHLNLFHISQKSNNPQLILMTRDHIQPLARGGKDEIDNLATMCSHCNQAKASNFPLEFVLKMTGWYKDNPLPDEGINHVKHLHGGGHIHWRSEPSTRSETT